MSSNAEKNLMIVADRLWESLMELAKIGPGVAGGNNRQTLTDEDSEARNLLKSWCDKAGLSISIDAMGSMFAERDVCSEDYPCAPCDALGMTLYQKDFLGNFVNETGLNLEEVQKKFKYLGMCRTCT